MDDEVVKPKPWDKMPEESTKAFEAFARYRDLGAQRSLSKAAAELGKSKPLLEGWSSKYSWQERITAWDAAQDRVNRRERRRAIVTMSRRHAEMAVAFQAKVIQRLKALKPEEMSVGEALRVFAIAVKIERDARRIPMRDAVQDYATLEQASEVVDADEAPNTIEGRFGSRNVG